MTSWFSLLTYEQLVSVWHVGSGAFCPASYLETRLIYSDASG